MRRFWGLWLAVLLSVSGWLPATGVAGTPGILVVAQDLDDITSLDPAEGFELSSEQAFTNLYQRLIQSDPDHPGTISAVLASAWKPGATPQSLVFELRAGAVFASGHPVRPEDVLFSLSRAVKLNRAPVFILNELGWRADNVDRYLHRLDATHVEIDWPAPVSFAFALNILSAPVASILDAQAIAAHEVDGDAGNRYLHDHSAGSGPFTIRRYIPHEALVLDANPRSPGDRPLLHTVVIRNVADAGTRELLLRVGDADIARDLGPDQLDALRVRADLKFPQFPSASVHYLLFNAANTQVPALSNPGLWEAARWLVDYEGIAHQLLKDQYEVHQAFLARGFPGALDATPYHLDVARARRILEAAGLGRGLTLTLDVFNQSPYLEIAQSLQSTFGAAGVHLELRPALTGEVYTRVRARDEQAVWLYWIPDYYDAHSTAGAFALNREDGTKTLAWRAGWHIPQLTDRTLRALQEPDATRREALYGEIQTEVQRTSPFVIALQEKREVAMRASVRGYRQGLDADMVYYDRVSK